MTLSVSAAPAGPTKSRRPGTAVQVTCGVGLLGFLFRFLVPLLHGGLGSPSGNDPGVYYSAADAMTHGLMPYRDFSTVHPPLLPLVLTPFAAIGRLTTDSFGFALAAFVICVLGGVNAALTVTVARRWGCSLAAAACGGLVYAASYAALTAEHAPRLEPVGNTFLLLALLWLAPRARRTGPAHPLLAGLALGAAVSTKIWWAAPALLLLVAVLVQEVRGRDRELPEEAAPRPRSATLLLLAGGAVSALVINIVPFAADPKAMITLVIGHQLDRADAGMDHFDRFVAMPGGDVLSGAALPGAAHTVAIITLVVIALAALVAVRTPLGRLVVPLLILQVLVIVVAPSWYYYYADYTAVSIALVLAAGIDRGRFGRIPSPALTASVLVIALGLFALATSGDEALPPPPGLSAVSREMKSFDCVVSNTPMALIQTDGLDRSFGPGCHNWVDLPGLHLSHDKVSGFRLLPEQNMGWRSFLDDYLRSGDAVLIKINRVLPPKVLQDIREQSQLVIRRGRFELYRVSDPVVLPAQ